MNKIFIFCIGLLFFAPANASDPLVFSREEITVLPKAQLATASAPEPAEAKEPDSAKSEIAKPEEKPAMERHPITLVVEFHPESFLYQPGMTIIDPVQNKNYLMILAANEKSALKFANIYAPVDIVFITPDGTISQIAPKLVLHDLKAPVSSNKPVKAFLMLSEGEAETLDIRPGDQVVHSLFQPVIKINKAQSNLQ